MFDIFDVFITVLGPLRFLNKEYISPTINTHCFLQHKDDPLFAEFIEAHTNDKTAWIKNAFVDAAKSDDDDDSGVEGETHKNIEKVDSKENKTEVVMEKKQVKLANKQISDLEVMMFILNKTLATPAGPANCIYFFPNLSYLERTKQVK